MHKQEQVQTFAFFARRLTRLQASMVLTVHL